MVIGASWNGARAFTSTAGPGISLMNELLGLAYYAEIPAVVIDVQRVGPSTGMPTRTQQGDILECAYASHGDTKHILLFPANPAECFEFAVKSFDLAERFQTPVFMLSDLDIGMNDWVVPRSPGTMPIARIAAACWTRTRSKSSRSSSAIPTRTRTHVAARTLPGVHSKGAFFTRGSGHNKFGGYTEIPDEYQEVVDRLLRKHKAAAKFVPAPDHSETQRRDRRHHHHRRLRSGGARSDRTARRSAASTRITCASADSRSAKRSRHFLDEHDFCFVVEQNRDAQLRSLLMLETTVPKKNCAASWSTAVPAEREARDRRNSRTSGRADAHAVHR